MKAKANVDVCDPTDSKFQTHSNMQKNQTIISVTYILGGELLQLANGVGSSWASAVASIIGFILFLNGLTRLQDGLDPVGRSAAAMLRIAAVIGALASLIDVIPLLGILASLGYMAAFGIQFLGFVKLKNSNSLNALGQGGVSLLLLAMGLGFAQALLFMIPILGGYIAPPVALAALLAALFGWIRIQEDLISQAE